MAHLETHADTHYGHCQSAVVDFDIHNPNLTYIGPPLQLPGAPAYKTYHVARRGETLTNIASLYNVPVQELRTASALVNRATQLGCEPNGNSTRVQGTVRLNGQPISGCPVVFSWQPDGNVVARRVTGAGAPPGRYTHILQGGARREGSWSFWLESIDVVRIYVDYVPVVADWIILPATRSFGDIYLSRGNHTIRVEYFEAGGLASISVCWEKRR